jgi:hypothetical protein
MHEEAVITINGAKLTDAESMKLIRHIMSTA